MTHSEYKTRIEKINQEEKQLLNQFNNNNSIIERINEIKESANLQRLAALLGVNNE